MSKVKKILAVILSLAMIMGMSVTTFASETGTPTQPVVPSATDVKTATVSNVEAGATVTAYKIVDANYNTAGFTGYSSVKVNDVALVANALAPTSTEITAIANMTNKSSLTSATMTAGAATDGYASFTADLSAGSWMVLVTGNVKEVYNPMLVSVYYTVGGSNNTMTGGVVNADSNWTLVTNNAYAKSTNPGIDKEIVGGDKDVAIGSTVDFKITTNIPSYSADYSEVIVKITDELSTGLTLDTTSIDIGSVDAANYTLNSDTDGFELTIASAYALTHGGEQVVVTYSATVNENAGLNFDANTNTATLEYSNDPSDSTKTKPVKDKTYTYTFAIGANLFGSATDTWNKITNELLKTGEIREITNESGETVRTNTLPGAEFKLTNTATKKEYNAKSGDMGQLSFKGLDVGTYKLVETAAPAGYSLSTVEHDVVIAATYKTDGTLESYTITIDGEATSTYTATYTGTGTDTSISTIAPAAGNESTEVQNTKLSALPSTGGIGTTIFTIGGVAIMILAAAAFFFSRKKSRQ